MVCTRKLPQWLLLFLLVVSLVHAQTVPEVVRTDGIYRSEVQTNEDGTEYVSMLRFAPSGKVFLMQVAMPARQERVCEWFTPVLERPDWATGTEYLLSENGLSFRTVSTRATTLFDGTIGGGVLRLKLVVPTKRNLTYYLTFVFAPCP